MAALGSLLPLSIALWSSYALSLSVTSIRAIRTYEGPTQTAAKYSNIAEDTLKQTRSTEAAGAAATLLSLGTSLFLVLQPLVSAPKPHDPTVLNTTTLALAALNGLAAYAARVHVEGFWRGKAKIPMMAKYNEAIESAGKLRRALHYMSLAWGMEVLGEGIEWFGS